MKDSIKRAQSRAGSGFAERENFRPKVKHLKRKLMMTLVALLAVTTGAYATEFTSLKVGDVLHVGDVINTSTNYKVLGGDLDANFQPATLVRGNIDGMTITESETGAYYLLKIKNGSFFGTIMSPMGYDGGYWPVTDTSDGISVTAITPGDYTELTFAVHEGTTATTVPLTWDAASPNTATLTNGMPAGNVTVSVEYYPQATAEGAVTAATGVKATTEDALVTIDKNKLTGVAKMMYYVSADAEATAPAYDAEGWTDKVPTAENYTQAADLKVWYYPVGADDEDPAKTYSDGDMNATALAVTLLPEPTYDVTLNDEGLSTDEAAAWKVAKGTDDPAAFPLEGVKKGDKVTVTYTGTKKVLGVKAEKKATKLTITIPATENAAALTLDVTGCTTWEQILNQNVTTLDYEGDGVYGQTSNCYILDGNNNRLNLNTPYDPTTNYHWGTQR